MSLNDVLKAAHEKLHQSAPDRRKEQGLDPLSTNVLRIAEMQFKCDDCPFQETYRGRSFDAVEKFARSQGWWFREPRAKCPQHAQQQKEARNSPDRERKPAALERRLIASVSKALNTALDNDTDTGVTPPDDKQPVPKAA